MVNLNMLKEWNEEENRDDCLYQIDYTIYKKMTRDYADKDGEETFGKTNDLNEALEMFRKCIDRCDKIYDYYNVRLMEAFENKYGSIEYDVIEEETNIKVLYNRSYDAEIIDNNKNYEEKLEFIKRNKSLFSMRAVCEKADVNYQVYKNSSGRLSKTMVDKLFNVFNELNSELDDLKS